MAQGWPALSPNKGRAIESSPVGMTPEEEPGGKGSQKCVGRRLAPRGGRCAESVAPFNLAGQLEM